MGRHISLLKKCIREHVAAEIEVSWRGSKHPDDWPAIDRESARAKKRLDEAVNKIAMELSNPERH